MVTGILLTETTAITWGNWLVGLPLLVVFLFVLKLLLTCETLGGRIASAIFLCLLAGLGYLIRNDLGNLPCVALLISAVLGVSNLLLHLGNRERTNGRSPE